MDPKYMVGLRSGKLPVEMRPRYRQYPAVSNDMPYMHLV